MHELMPMIASPTNGARVIDAKQLASLYMAVKERVIDAGFADEIDWQDEVTLDELDETSFLRESAWVILSSGMREVVVRTKFPAFSRAFLDWVSARAISRHSDHCRRSALSVFGHEGKVDAILAVALEINRVGFGNVRHRVQHEGVDYLQSFPYLGPATSHHLAKNLGMEVVKPDRHLTRVAEQAGYASPRDLCRDIAVIVGDKASVVDIVIWRYATLSWRNPATCAAERL